MLYHTRKNVFIITFQKRRKEKKGKQGRKEKGERRKEKGERRKEKGEKRKEKGERRKECPIEAILNNHSVKLF